MMFHLRIVLLMVGIVCGFAQKNTLVSLDPVEAPDFSTCKSLKEIMQFNLDDTLQETIRSLLPTQMDTKKTLPDNIFGMLPTFFGNASDIIMSQEVGKLVPLDTKKNLHEHIDTILEMWNVPVNTTESLPEALVSLLPLLPLDTSKTLTETIAALLPMLLGANSSDAIEQILKQRINEFLPLDTSETLPETIDTILKVLNLPVNTTESLPEALTAGLTALLAVLPLDKSKTVPETIAALLPMLLGATNLTEQILKQRIIDFLPVPLDTSKSLPENVDTVLKMLQLPMDAVTVLTALAKLLPFDQTKTVPEAIVAVLPMLLGVNDTDMINHILTSSIVKLYPESPIPLDTHKTLPETVDTILKIFKLPVDTSESLDTALAALIPLLPLNKTQPISLTIASMLPTLLGVSSTEQINQIMSTAIGNFLPVQLDTSKTLPETVDTMLNMFQFPVNTSQSLDTALAVLIPLLPLNKTQPISLTIASMLPTLLGVSSTEQINQIMSTTLGKLLPLPLDTSKGLRDNIAAMLPMFLPSDIVNVSVSENIENLLKAMNVDVNALTSQTMAVMLQQMLSPMANNNTAVESAVDILRKNTTKNFNETLSQMAEDLGSKLPVNSTKQLVDGTMRQLLPGDTGNILANMVGTFFGLNTTREIASIVNLDPNSPFPEVMGHAMGMMQQCDALEASVEKEIFGQSRSSESIADSDATITTTAKTVVTSAVAPVTSAVAPVTTTAKTAVTPPAVTPVTNVAFTFEADTDRDSLQEALTSSFRDKYGEAFRAVEVTVPDVESPLRRRLAKSTFKVKVFLTGKKADLSSSVVDFVSKELTDSLDLCSDAKPCTVSAPVLTESKATVTADPKVNAAATTPVLSCTAYYSNTVTAVLILLMLTY